MSVRGSGRAGSGRFFAHYGGRIGSGRVEKFYRNLFLYALKIAFGFKMNVFYCFILRFIMRTSRAMT